MLRLLRQPVDKEKWTTEPAVVNAFYNPNKNDIGGSKDHSPANSSYSFAFVIYLSISCWHPAAAILQPALSQVLELRRNRSGHWPRDYPRIR